MEANTTDMAQLLQFMKEQGMAEQSQAFAEMLQYMGNMQLQMGLMVNELKEARLEIAQLREMQPKSVSDMVSEKVEKVNCHLR